MLLEHVQYLNDVEGRDLSLHDIRDKDGRVAIQPAARWLAELAA